MENIYALYITVAFLYAMFLACRWVWRLAQRHVPRALENTARATGKATTQASAFGGKLKEAFNEGRQHSAATPSGATGQATKQASEFGKKVFNEGRQHSEKGSEPITFEKWYAVFKQTAAMHNPQLQQDASGRSLIDFMDHEPLKRAFRDGLEPKSLARHLAPTFDAKSFGR